MLENVIALRRDEARIRAEIDTVMRAWALVETSRAFRSSKRERVHRICIQEQADNPDLSGPIVQVCISTWRDAVIGLARLTDLQSKNRVTLPHIRRQILMLSDLNSVAETHHNYFLIKQDRVERDRYLARLMMAQNLFRTHCYSTVSNGKPDVQCELWTMRCVIHPIRNEWLAHIKHSSPFVLSEHTRMIRRALIITGALGAASQLLMHGTDGMSRRSFMQWMRRMEQFWLTFEFGFRQHHEVQFRG